MREALARPQTGKQMLLEELDGEATSHPRKRMREVMRTPQYQSA